MLLHMMMVGHLTKKEKKHLKAGTKLLLAPGISQVYYGDEVLVH
jgi:hypothetical protein